MQELNIFMRITINYNERTSKMEKTTSKLLLFFSCAVLVMGTFSTVTFASDDAAVAESPVSEEAGDQNEYTIVIKDHKFTPEEVTVPADQKIKLIIDNQDATPEEFESHDLNREKIIAGNKQATIFIGPLKPGKYHFFGEFNMDTANGYVIVE